MLSRIPLLASFGLAASVAFASDQALPVSVLWSGGETSPGICVGKKGWFVTVAPASLEANPKEPIISVGETRADAQILHFDEEHRLCLLETEGQFDDLTLFTLTPDPVVAAGTLLKTLSPDADCRSTVAGKDWTYRGENLDIPLLRIRIENAGDSSHAGTPLVNESGQVEALLTDRKLEESGEAHAIPAAQIHKLVSDMDRYNRTGTVRIGLLLHEHSSTPEILGVSEDSPAAKSGFASGDVVLSLNGTEISDLDDLVEAIHHLPAGETAIFGVLRGLEREEIKVVPEFASD